MASHLVKSLHPSYARIVNPTALIGKHDVEKCHMIHQIFDNSDKAEFSVIIIDTFERLIEWCPIGSMLNNQILQVILTLMRKSIKSNSKLVMITTCYDYNLLKKLEVDNLFDLHFNIPHTIDPGSAKLFGYETTQPVELSVVLHHLK